jgi:hypothetical protein
MTLFVVETQNADYLFHCPSAAASFAAEKRRWWIENCPPMGTPPIFPVPMGPQHRFRTDFADTPLEAGPGQDSCSRVQRHVRRWWAERDAWWNAPQPA